MKKKMLTLCVPIVSYGLSATQSYAHPLSAPHAHLEPTAVMLIGVIAAISMVATYIVKRR